jgi:Flp pilus assembly CpaF family ATPase
MRNRKERCNLHMGSQFPDRWQHGSKSDRMCPRLSSATSIGLRSRTLATTNLVRFEARQEQNGVRPVVIRDLLKAALRHRPDRILLGEIRGGEAFDLLQLLNTGHSGTLSTIHANSAHQGLARFTSCVLQSGLDLPYRAIKTNIGDSVNVVIHIERRPGQRFISEVLEVNCFNPDADLFDYCVMFQRQEAQR